MGIVKDFLNNKLNGFTYDEEGQGMVEYALIIGVLAIGIVVTLGITGDNVFKVYTEKIVNRLIEAFKGLI